MSHDIELTDCGAIVCAGGSTDIARAWLIATGVQWGPEVWQPTCDALRVPWARLSGLATAAVRAGFTVSDLR